MPRVSAGDESNVVIKSRPVAISGKRLGRGWGVTVVLALIDVSSSCSRSERSASQSPSSGQMSLAAAEPAIRTDVASRAVEVGDVLAGDEVEDRHRPRARRDVVGGGGHDQQVLIDPRPGRPGFPRRRTRPRASPSSRYIIRIHCAQARPGNGGLSATHFAIG